MKPKTEDEIYEDYLMTFPEEVREIGRPYLKDTFGFAAYNLGIRCGELGDAIKEESKKVVANVKDKLY